MSHFSVHRPKHETDPNLNLKYFQFHSDLSNFAAATEIGDGLDEFSELKNQYFSIDSFSRSVDEPSWEGRFAKCSHKINIIPTRW